VKLPKDKTHLQIDFIRRINKKCKKDLNDFLITGSENDELSFGYPLIQFSPP
jgi:hypothetical protein